MLLIVKPGTMKGYNNIINAKKTGITGIVFENANQLEEELRKLNIEI